MAFGIGLDGRAGDRLAVLAILTGVMAAANPSAHGSDQRRTLIPTDFTCALVERAPKIAQIEGGAIIVTCPATEEVVATCDREGFEPIDIPGNAVCNGPLSTGLEGRVLRIRADRDDGAVVRWLNGASAVPIASRPLSSLPGNALRVAMQQDRVLQIHRESASPVSVLAQSLAQAEVWLVPPAAPGGELVLHVAQSVVAPESIEVADSGVLRSAPIAGGFASLPGLTPGLHHWSLVFAGGIKSTARTATVRAQESTITAVTPGNVGGIALTVDPRTCDATSSIVISSIDGKGTGGETTSALMQVEHERDCDRRFGGLQPGTYEVSLRNGGSVFRSSRLEVSPQEWSRAVLQSQPVTVRGTALLNGRPLSGRPISFALASLQSLAAPSAAVTTRGDGSFEVELPEPGKYRISLSRDGRSSLGLTRVAEFTEGTNFFDWKATGGSLSVDLTGWDRTSDVSVTLAQEAAGAGSAVAQTSFRITPTDKLPLIIPALPEGRFSIRARQRDQEGRFDGKASQEESVLVTADAPEQEVTLRLSAATVMLKIVDPFGEPVLGAEIQGARASEGDTPGTFVLRAVSSGARLLINAPGLVPTCLLAPSEGQTVVRLDKGMDVNVEIDSLRNTFFQGFVRWKSGQCPVAIGAFKPAAAAPEGDRAIAVLHNFPILKEIEFSQDLGFVDPRVLLVINRRIRITQGESIDSLYSSGRLRPAPALALAVVVTLISGLGIRRGAH